MRSLNINKILARFNFYSLSSLKPTLSQKIIESSEIDQNNFFIQFFEEAPLGFHSLDENGNIIMINKKWTEMTGYSKKEIVGQWFGNLLHEKYVDIFLKYFAHCKTEIKIHEVELEIKKKDGSTIMALLSGRVLYDKKGKVLQTLCVIKDITAIKQMEANLKESEAKYKLLFEESNDGICFLSHEDEQGCGEFLEVNETYCKMLGYTREELQNIRPEKIIFRDKLKDLERIRKALLENKKHVYETILQHKNGRKIIVEINSQLTEYKGKKATISIIRDITQRKQVENEVIKKQKQLNSLLNNINALIIELNHNKLNYIGGRFEQILGNVKINRNRNPFKADEFLGKRIHIKDRESVAKAIEEAVASSRDISLEFRIISDNDKVQWFYCQICPDKEDNEIIRLIMVDISEQKFIEKQFQQAEQKWRKLIENSPHNILILNNNGKVLFSNKPILDFAPDKIEGKSIYNLFETRFQPIAKSHLETVFNMNTTQNFEVKMRKYNKSNFWYDIIIAPLHFEEKIDHAILVASDITQRKKTERELKQTTKMLRNLSNRLQNLIEIERTTIAREIHDDLGQSITALQMDLYWLRKKAQGHHELQTKLSQMIEYTNTIIGDIHRICTNLRPGILDELGFIPAIEWQIKEFQKRTQIKCKVKIANRDIAIDKERMIVLFRIFQETLTNILRHANAKNVTISLAKKRDSIILIVQDDGIGITKQQISSVSSLGIIGMKERLIPFNGNIKFSGKKNKGTIVKISLPLENQEFKND